MIYFFFADGQLCNQLFQYSFIKTHIRNKNKIICSNFSELEKLINLKKDKNLIIFNNKLIKFFLRRFFYYILKFFSEIGFIYSIKVRSRFLYGSVIEYNDLIFKDGLISWTLIYPCYFQNDKFFNKKIVKDFKVYKQHDIRAKIFLECIPRKFNPVFVHIRTSRIFNEYKKFKIFGYLGVHLPINYYKSCIEWFLKNISNPYFIFISDNIPYIKNKFSYLENKIFSKNSIFVDLMIISKCSYGVMSNSSVSWWGGYLNNNKKKIFAPKYWLGWKRKITLQHSGEPKYATLIDPNLFKNKYKNNLIN
jgi:hypothetical protein